MSPKNVSVVDSEAANFTLKNDGFCVVFLLCCVALMVFQSIS